MLDSFLEAFFSIGEKIIDFDAISVFNSPHNRLIKPVTLYYYDAKTPGTSWFYKGSFRKVAGNFFIIKGNAFSNIIQVGPTYNRVELCDTSSFNTVQGNLESDIMGADNNASHNIFNGGEGDDWLGAWNNASKNIFNGGNGNDILSAVGKAFSNFFNGGDGDDVALSLAGGTFDGGQGDDFIINHLVDQKFVANVIAKGGDGQDVLIHSAFFWQTSPSEFKDYKRHDITRITLDGGDGDDIIMPYLQADFSGANLWVATRKIMICTQHLTPSPAIIDNIYDITPGLGCDVICLTDRPAEATQTIIKGFDFTQDQLAFPNQVMADAVLPHLLKAQAENLPIIEWIYNGHHYRLEDNQYAKIQTQPGTLSYKIWDESLTNRALAKVSSIRRFDHATLLGIFTRKTTP